MTALAQGFSATVSVGDGGFVSVATNGGFGSVVITPATGSAQTVSLGPLSERRKFGPFTEGASVAFSNSTCGSFDYDFDGRSSPVALYSRSGVSLASPLATLTGVTSGVFSVAGFPYSFAAGSLASPGDVLHVMAMVRKRGANSTATVNVSLGVNNSTADGAIASLLATNVDSQDLFLVGSMFVGSASNGIANLAAAWNSQGQSRFSNVLLSPASTMYLNIGVTGASAADSFDLLAARAWIEKATV